jgi:hypothetical protein
MIPSYIYELFLRERGVKIGACDPAYLGVLKKGGKNPTKTLLCVMFDFKKNISSCILKGHLSTRNTPY